MQSMTGFSKQEAVVENTLISIECKSHNNRFKDIKLRLPTWLGFLDFEFRKLVEQTFVRGSFEITVSAKSSQGQGVGGERIVLNHPLIGSLIEQMRQHLQAGEGLTLNPADFLRKEFLIEESYGEEHPLVVALREQMVVALKRLAQSRAEEGKKLVEVIRAHIEEFRVGYSVIESQAGQLQAEMESKLTKRLMDLPKGVDVDPGRFHQEVLYTLEKRDISEELNRIQAHLAKLIKIISGHQRECGREIDFVLQELNREVNTIGSKSDRTEISGAVIGMKVQLEKMREQALNLE